MQQKAIADDRLVFKPQGRPECVHITFERIVMLILHDRRDDAGRGGSEKGLPIRVLVPSEGNPKVGAFRFDHRGIRV